MRFNLGKVNLFVQIASDSASSCSHNLCIAAAAVALRKVTCATGFPKQVSISTWKPQTQQGIGGSDLYQTCHWRCRYWHHIAIYDTHDLWEDKSADWTWAIQDNSRASDSAHCTQWTQPGQACLHNVFLHWLHQPPNVFTCMSLLVKFEFQLFLISFCSSQGSLHIHRSSHIV